MPPTSTDSDQQERERKQRLEEMEAKAVDKAKANADAAFRPPPSVLNAQSATVLLQQVDGPSLKTYKDTESVYVGRSVPVAAGGHLNVPINVSTPGSVVEYAVELKGYDISFGIKAEREEGVTVVKVRTVYAIELKLLFEFLFAFCLTHFAFHRKTIGSMRKTHR